jgi:hypothetical protein
MSLAIVMILASDVEAPWKILFELVAVRAFLGFLLQFWGTVQAARDKTST